MFAAPFLIVFNRRRLDLDLHSLQNLSLLYPLIRVSHAKAKDRLLAVVAGSISLCFYRFRCYVRRISGLRQYLQAVALVLPVTVLAGVAIGWVTVASVAVAVRAKFLAEEFE